MVSMTVVVQQVVEVLEEEADLQQFQDQQSVEDVAKRTLKNSGTSYSPVQMKT